MFTQLESIFRSSDEKFLQHVRSALNDGKYIATLERQRTKMFAAILIAFLAFSGFWFCVMLAMAVLIFALPIIVSLKPISFLAPSSETLITSLLYYVFFLVFFLVPQIANFQHFSTQIKMVKLALLLKAEVNANTSGAEKPA